MKVFSNILILFFLCIYFPLNAQISFINHANFHTIGVCLDANWSDPEGDLVIVLEYKLSSSSDWLQGMEMVQSNSVHPNWYNSSIFNCQPDTEYDVKATLTDPTTTTLNTEITETIKTQSEAFFTNFTKTYYVSPDGSDSAFTESNPGQFTQAIQLVQAGERVFLKSGTYSIGELEFHQSGTITEPITIEGATDGEVIIDGSEVIDVWADDASTGGYKANISNMHCNVVIAEGRRLYPHKSRKEMKFHKIGWQFNCRDSDVDGFFTSGNNSVLRLKFRNNADANTKDIKVGKYEHFLELIQVNNIRFSNISIRYFGSRNSAAVILKNSNNIRFDACDFQFNDIGIRLEEESNNVIVRESNFSDGYGHWNYWRMKATYLGVYVPICSGNNPLTDQITGSNEVNLYSFRGLEKGGIFVSGNYSGSGLIVKNSTFHDMVQGLSLRPQSWWVDTGENAEVDFYNNTVYDCSEDGLEMDVFPRNVRIWNNEFHDVNMAISLAPGADGPVYIYRNLFHDFTTDTTWIPDFNDYVPGRPLKMNTEDTGDPNDDSGIVYFINNTVYAEADHYSMDILKPVSQTWNRFIFMNNIWKAEDQLTFRVRAGSLGALQADYNCLFNTQTDLLEYDGNTFTDLGTYTNQYGVEANSLKTNPLFTDATSDIFTLSMESPLIDSGLAIAGLNDDYKGSAPDVGAFESDFTSEYRQEESIQSLRFYPNPVGSTVRLELGTLLSFEYGQLTVLDVEGQVVLQETIGYNDHIIDTKEWSGGIYLVTIIVDNHVFVGKLVKLL